MNSDDFEKRLQSQPMRQIPTEWRRQILSEAQISTRNPKPETRNWLSTLLWPNPKAWVGLAVVWIAIFALQAASRDRSRMVTTIVAAQRAAFWNTLKDEQQTLVELMGNSQPVDADQPRSTGPKPRSERRSTTAIV